MQRGAEKLDMIWAAAFVNIAARSGLAARIWEDSHGRQGRPRSL